MTIKKFRLKIVSKIVLGMMIVGSQSTATLGMETPKPNGAQSSLVRSSLQYMKYSIDIEYLAQYGSDSDIHCIGIPNGLHHLDRLINSMLKEKNLPHFDMIALADPRIKSKGFCLRRGQMNFLGPLIGGHENFIKLDLKYIKPHFGVDFPETVHHIDGINYFINLEDLTITNYTESGYSNGLYADGRYESIKSLPTGIKALHKLKSLTLDESCLEALPSDLHELPCLESFNLTYYNFSLDPLWTMTNLKKLVLKGGNITKRIFEPDYQFQTDNFSLKELPGEIGNLVNLEILELTLNELSDLPNTLACLINLKELSLECNEFVILPPVIGTLVSLQNLCVRMNKLEEFPEILLNLTNLEKLNLRSNHKITKITSKIHKLITLNELLLEQNRGLHSYWAKNWKRHVEQPTPENLAELRLQLISYGVQDPDGVLKNALSDLNRENYNLGPKLQDFLADQKMLYDIVTKNILVILWFKELIIPQELGSILHGFITDLHIRDTVMYQELHPVRQINADNEDDTD